MARRSTTAPQSHAQGRDRLIRLGGWLFGRRTWLPIPIAIAILLLAPAEVPPRVLWSGVGLVTAGETLRLWAVGHIGAVSRTRSDRLGPLVSGGPFALVRNPLYLGNMALWVGFAVSAHLVWLVPVIALLLAAQYHAIVRWEERLLESRLGERYRIYAARVPRWIPRPAAAGDSDVSSDATFTWRETFFSERGTLIAIGLGYALLYLKRHVTVDL